MITQKIDLYLIKLFLFEATYAISMNNLVFRKPSITYQADASEFGIGGYNITSGKLGIWKYLKISDF